MARLWCKDMDTPCKIMLDNVDVAENVIWVDAELARSQRRESYLMRLQHQKWFSFLRDRVCCVDLSRLPTGLRDDVQRKAFAQVWKAQARGRLLDWSAVTA